MYILQNKPIDSANNHIDRSSNILFCFVLLASTMQSVYLHLSIFFSNSTYNYTSICIVPYLYPPFLSNILWLNPILLSQAV